MSVRRNFVDEDWRRTRPGYPTARPLTAGLHQVPPNAGTVGQFGTTVAGRSPLSHDLKIDPAESEDWTMAEESKPAEVSRRIEAPAALIFKILANPQRHVDFDGSGMLRGAVLDRPISEVGDTFSMKMHRLGDDYLMLNYVVEFEPDRRIFWEPAPGDHLGLRIMIHPRSAFLPATAGATS